tara:strand:- start:115 stop:546 length:432 start_codon:yes stop_codon:yes gene_type:complete
MRKRTQARHIALQFLYQMDIRVGEVLDEMDTFISKSSDDPEVNQFALSLIQGVIEHRKEIDDQIVKTAKNWDLHRMAIIDRNVLRIATHEILHRDDIPTKVSINEAIDLGKEYSTQQSGAFINGILDRIVRDKNGTEPNPETE